MGTGRGVSELVEGGVEDVSLVVGEEADSVLVVAPFVDELVTGGAGAGVVAAESGVVSEASA